MVLDRLTAAMGDRGEARPGQHAMAHAVAQAISTESNLVVQAGTGTGKSLAYLAAAAAMGAKTVIATATKALQDQLADSDLPFLVEHGGKPVTWAVLKGRSNYLCRQRFDEIADPAQRSLEGLETLPERELEGLRTWVEVTTTGDRAELDVEPSVATWAAVSVGPQECPGAQKCPRGDDCFAETARRRAGAADITVVNTHLYGLHLASGRMVLADHDLLIIDEAHELPDIVSATAGIELSAGRFDNVARIAGGLLAEDVLVESIHTIGERIVRAVAPFAGNRLVGGVPAQVADLLVTAGSRLAEVADALRKIDTKASPDVATRAARVQTASTALANDVATFLAPPTDAVVWVENDRDRARLCLAPLDVGATLEELLWNPETTGLEIGGSGPDEDDDSGPGRGGLPATVVLTSATIPGGLADQLRLPPDDTEILDVGTPFDFGSQGLLYCASHLPDPRADGYADALVDELVTLLDLSGGRALCLFTSYRVMQLASAAVAERVEYQILVQGTRPKGVLVRAFAVDTSSCLFATMGYWQGIDVPGPALSLVTIDRIPFPRPDEPLWQARREAAGPRAFTAIDVPRAATLLAQGAGRLIRSATDRGVVAILDSRLATAKSYRWQLIAALPPLRRTADISEVATFFAAE